VAGPGREPVRLSVNWPERTRRSFRLHRRGPDPARGDMVIGAFVLVLPDRKAPPERPVPPGRAGPTGRPGSASAGSERLARAVWLVEQGADTLKRTRRAQYRG